jgi:hypothetical protein
MICTIIDDRLRRIWAILIGMTVVAVTVGMVTVMIRDRTSGRVITGGKAPSNLQGPKFAR